MYVALVITGRVQVGYSRAALILQLMRYRRGQEAGRWLYLQVGSMGTNLKGVATEQISIPKVCTMYVTLVISSGGYLGSDLIG